MQNNKYIVRPLTTALLTVGSLFGAANAGEFDNSNYNVTTPLSTLEKGDWLVGFSGSYNHISTSAGSFDFFYADVDFSYFFHDNWSAGASTFGILVPSNGEIDDTGYAFGLEPNLRYYFQNSSKYTPYAGAHAGFAYGELGSEGDSLYTYGAHAGVLFPLTESSFFDVQLKWTEYDLPGDADEIDLDTLQVLLGFRIQF